MSLPTYMDGFQTFTIRPLLSKLGIFVFIASCTSGISIPLFFCSGFLGLITGMPSSSVAGFVEVGSFPFLGLGLFKKPFLNPPNDF